VGFLGMQIGSAQLGACPKGFISPRAGSQHLKNIYVGNLPFSTNEAELKQLFEATAASPA